MSVYLNALDPSSAPRVTAFASTGATKFFLPLLVWHRSLWTDIPAMWSKAKADAVAACTANEATSASIKTLVTTVDGFSSSVKDLTKAIEGLTAQTALAVGEMKSTNAFISNTVDAVHTIQQDNKEIAQLTLLSSNTVSLLRRQVHAIMEEHLRVHVTLHSQYQVFDASGGLPFSFVFGLCQHSSADSDPMPLTLNTRNSVFDVPWALANGLLELCERNDQGGTLRSDGVESLVETRLLCSKHELASRDIG